MHRREPDDHLVHEGGEHGIDDEHDQHAARHVRGDAADERDQHGDAKDRRHAHADGAADMGGAGVVAASVPTRLSPFMMMITTWTSATRPAPTMNPCGM